MRNPAVRRATAARRSPAARRAPLWAWAMIAVGIALVVVAVLAARHPAAPASSLPTASATQTWSPVGVDPVAYAHALVVDTNAARAAAGFAPLTESACARTAAAGRAQALTGDRPLVHASLVPVMQACDPSGPAAENLSRAAADPQAVVDAWLASPGHRDNLLDPALARVGIACVPDAGRMLCSQVFLGP